VERRQTTDLWAKLLFYLNIFAWIILVCMLFVFHRAQPEFESFFDRFYKLDLRTTWDIRYLNYLIYTVITGIIISLSGLVLGIFRGRRQNDHKKALIITGIISLALLVIAMFIL
jgi:hypothetical protein